jgi:hypothetical protein
VVVKSFHSTQRGSAMMFNKSANTDPQQQKAASPQALVVRLPLRYASSFALARLDVQA